MTSRGTATSSCSLGRRCRLRFLDGARADAGRPDLPRAGQLPDRRLAVPRPGDLHLRQAAGLARQGHPEGARQVGARACGCSHSAPLPRSLGSQAVKEITSGTLEDIAEGTGITLGTLAAILAAPARRTPMPTSAAPTPGSTPFSAPRSNARRWRRPRERRASGTRSTMATSGEFFRLFIEGATHFLFAQDIQRRSTGTWGSITPIPAHRVSEVYRRVLHAVLPPRAHRPAAVRLGCRASDPAHALYGDPAGGRRICATATSA